MQRSLRRASRGPAALPAEQRQVVTADLPLARTLDAGTEILEGRDVARCLLGYARDHQITPFLLGRSSRGWWEEFLHGSVINEVIRQAEGINVHIVADR